MEAWSAKETDVAAISRRAAATLLPCSGRISPARMGHPSVRAGGRARQGAHARREASSRSCRAARTIFSRADPLGERTPVLSVEVETATRNSSYIDPYAFGPALGPLDDYLLLEGTHRQLYRPARRAADTHEGVDGVLFARLGAQRDARLRRGRFQSLGRPPLPDAQALRQRPVGDFRSRSAGQEQSTNTSSSAPAAISCRSRRIRSASRRSCGPRPLRSSPTAPISTGPTPSIWPVAPRRAAAQADVDLRGPSRLVAAP